MSSSSWVHMVPHAKNVVVFRNGDPFHMGRRMVVNEKQFLTFEAFLNEVTGCIQAPVAVRSIYTPRNGHKVTDLGDLQNKGQYVAGGAEKFRRLDYLHTEIKPTAAPRIHRDTQQVSPKPNFLARWRKDTQLPCIIHVFRNGDLMTPPFRVLLPPSILKEWELVLTLLTQKVNLYSGAVRRLCTLDGVYLSNGSELVSGEYYVAVGSEKYKCLPYQELLIQHGDKTRTSAKRRIIKAGVGKVYSVSQDGVSDSALIDSSPQGDDRRVHSTGTAVKTSGPKHMAKKEESIFYAKPVRVHPNRKPKPNQEESSDRGGVFKVKETRHELEGAQEVREDEQTHVELPVDQRVAEVVQEENIAKDTKIQRKEGLNIQKGGNSLPSQQRKKEDAADTPRYPSHSDSD